MTSSIFFKGLQCDIPIDTRTFIEDERKKSNGNVCCRIATLGSHNIQPDSTLNRIGNDETPSTNVCNQRPGYRLVFIL